MVFFKLSKIGSFLLAAAIIIPSLSLFLCLELPIALSTDFLKLYVDLFGIAAGDPIYDAAAHWARYHQLDPLSSMPPFPPAYPPWYYAALMPLGMISLPLAAKIWVLTNFLLAFISLAVFTCRLSPAGRAVLLTMAVFFTPFIGHLVVGQQTIIVLAGAAFVAAASKSSNTALMILGFVLLSFKPHLGLPVAAGGVVLLWWFCYRPLISAVLGTAAVMLALAGLSFFIDSSALLTYPRALHELSMMPLNRLCDSCSSLSVALGNVPGVDSGLIWERRLKISAAIGIALFLPFLFYRRQNPALLCRIAGLTAWVLIFTPYARNYDYVLLLLPMTACAVKIIEVFSASDFSARRKTAALCAGLTITAYVFAEVITIFGSRTLQGSWLWCSAVAVYAAVFLLIRLEAIGSQDDTLKP